MSEVSRRHALKALGAAAGSFALSSSNVMAQSAGPTIRLGFITALTGPTAGFGQPMLLGANIAVDQINQKGGVNGKKLELVTMDYKGVTVNATGAARELIGNGINLLFGLIATPEAMAVSAIMEQEKAVLVSCGGQSDKLTKENFNRNFFRVTDNNYMRQHALAEFAATRYPNVTKWSAVIPDNDYGRGAWESYQDGLQDFYGSIAKKTPVINVPVKTQFGASDYRSGIAGLMSQDAEGFLVMVFGSDAVTFYKQAEAYGFLKKAKVLIDPANELTVAKAMRKDFPEMWVGGNWFATSYPNVATSRELNAEILKRTGDRFPSGQISEGHAAVMAYAKAIQAAGKTDTQSIIQALESVTFDTANGPRNFRKEDHQAVKPISLMRLRGSATSPDGLEILESLAIPTQGIIDPATPGKALVLKHPLG